MIVRVMLCNSGSKRDGADFVNIQRMACVLALIASAIVSLVTPSTARGAAPAQADKPRQPDAWITFDKEPIEHGMKFERQGVQAGQVQTPDGKAVNVWWAQNGSAPNVPWARSFLINFTDPSLRDGKQPVMDIEIEYRQAFDSPVELRIDAEKGSRNLGGGWGRNENIQVMKLTIDDGFFGARQHGNKPEDMHTDGYDLRINSFGTDFCLRSIKVYKYDLDKKPDYKRLVRFQGAETDNELFIFKPGSDKNEVRYAFRNLANKTAPLRFRHTLLDLNDKVVLEQNDRFILKNRATDQIKVNIDTRKLKLGAYRTRLQVMEKEDQVIFDRTGGFAVFDATEVPRAKPGEFLFGLDLMNGPFYGATRLLKWSQFMGVDIVRHGFASQDDVNEVASHIAEFEKYGLQNMFMCDPPKDQGNRTQQLPGKLDALRTIASRFPQIKYYELGNEPDLTFFYPGPMENYVADFQQMADAIRAGNPNAVVLNGGLCFAGREATERATKFIELVDPSKLGAWSYHGHGPGERAESMALNRIRDLVRANGKLDGKPFIDTETGVAASTPPQELVQAQTVVQKMVYAQSQGAPFLMFFRLYMFEEAYGMLFSDVEPRASVVSFANMTRTLRGTRFERELAGLRPGVRGYVLASEDKSRRVAVLWADAGNAQTLYLTLGGKAVDAKLVDLFGNASPLKTDDVGTAEVAVTENPVYVVVEKTSGDQSIAVLPMSIGVPTESAVRESGAGSLPVTVTALDAPIDGKIKVIAGDKSGIAPVKSDVPVAVKPHESVTIDVPVAITSAEANLEWPRQWTAFVDVDRDQFDAAKQTSIPTFLPGADGKRANAIQTPLRDDRIDFESLGGRMRERALAVVMVRVKSPIDQEVTVGASADWWMEWTVNGKVAYSTLDRGNGGGYAVTDHVFPIKLKKGDNLIVIRQLSGSMGWKLLIGSPQRIALAKADPAQIGVTFELHQQGRATQSARTAIRRTPEVTVMPDGIGKSLADWDAQQPDFVMLDRVANAYAPLPDSTHWWKGQADLSARGWVRRNKDDSLTVLVAVRDDQFKPASEIASAKQGDAIAIRLADESRVVHTVTVVPATPAVAQTDVDAIAPKATATRVGDMTFYAIDLTFASPAARPAYLDVHVFDQDAVAGKQVLSLADPNAVPQDGWQRIVWPAAK